jgi:hypothetical protein
MNTSGTFFWMIFFGAITWLVILFAVFRNIATRKDITTGSKTFWLIIIFFIPVAGLVAYLILGKKAVRQNDRKNY